MNETYAFVRNGRPVPWYEVDAWDLRVAILEFAETDYAGFAAREWARRSGRPVQELLDEK